MSIYSKQLFICLFISIYVYLFHDSQENFKVYIYFTHTHTPELIMLYCDFLYINHFPSVDYQFVKGSSLLIMVSYCTVLLYYCPALWATLTCSEHSINKRMK